MNAHNNHNHSGDESWIAGFDRRSRIAIASIVSVGFIVVFLIPALMLILIHSGNPPAIVKSNASIENTQ